MFTIEEFMGFLAKIITVILVAVLVFAIIGNLVITVITYLKGVMSI